MSSASMSQHSSTSAADEVKEFQPPHQGEDEAIQLPNTEGSNGAERAIPPNELHDQDDADGLFGSGSEDGGLIEPRKLDDEELDSGDDEDRNDRADGDGYDEEESKNQSRREATVLDADLGRHAIPHPSDNELYLMKLPNFLGIDPKHFHLNGFQPPTTDHHSSGPPSSTFSAYETANSTLRWRRSPKNSSKLQSNTRVLRWSDGSLTLQLASNPTQQYELPAKPLAPPQYNPPKPTPTAAQRQRNINSENAYDVRLDSHTYLTAPHELSQFIRVTNHLTASLTVLPSEQNDDALVRLQQSLAAAVKGNKAAPDGSVSMISISEDPELAKKKAEVAEREKVRAQRRRQQQEERERDRTNRVLGRSGLRTGGLGAGLTVGGLEDDDGMTTTRARPSKPKKKIRRRNSEYSEDEEDFRNRGRTKEDEYDANDGFLVDSDEEPELVPDESEEEEEEDEEMEEVEDENKAKEKSRKPSPKRERMNDAGDEAAAARGKRRRVVDEDEEE